MLGLFDEMNDLLQGALLRAAQHAHFNAAPQVQRAGQHAVADRLVHGQRFTGEVGFVGRSPAFADLGVHRELFARFDEQPHAGSQLLDRHRAFNAVFIHPRRHFRRGFEQRSDFTMGAAHRVMFERARK